MPMEKEGLRRRTGRSEASSFATHALTGEQSIEQRATEDFEATVAAAFYVSKGPELLQFAKGKVEDHHVKTKIMRSEDNQYDVLLMSLPFPEMLKTAEELSLRKRDLEGHVRSFRAADVHEFTSSPNASSLFTQSEQILLVEFCLDSIKPDSNFDDVKANESILEWCKRQHYLHDVFPLHHRETAQEILAELSFSNPVYDLGGISKIQDYFGDKVALYFAFLTFYTKSLVAYGIAGAVIATLSYIFPNRAPQLLFLLSIFATLWGASLMSRWKRKNIEIVYMWTSLIKGDSSDESLMSMTKKEDLRRTFFGIEVSHRITGEKVVIFPKRQKIIRYSLSAVVVIMSLVVSTKMMLWALDFEDVMHNWLDTKGDLYKWSRPFIMKSIVLKNVPMAVFIACLNILDKSYNILARKLTENENHKYNADFENSLVLKLVLFQFLNMNMSYLYVAFVRRDYQRLATAIRSILLIELVIGNVKEVIIPIFMARRARKAKLAEALKKKKEENPDLDETECFVEPSDLDPISTQLEMEPYDGVFDDYFELVRQFSQISLFAAAFPFGALLATLNNFIEIFSDSYKLVNMTRRASPTRALDIGAWAKAFDFISVMSVLTNLGIMTVTARHAKHVVGQGLSQTEEYFWMVVIEHLLLLSRFAFIAFFEGIPSWVRDQRDKERYLASKKQMHEAQ